MKNKKMYLKLLLDLVMLIVLVLLFRKDNFGLAFHEIAGLSLLCAFAVHIILNWRWVKQVTCRFFTENINIRTRIKYLINFGLLVCFIIIGISGILMSHVLFHFSIAGNWKTLHYFCSALAIILLGIHLGLHLTMIGGIIKSHIHINSVLRKTILCCLACAVVVIGIYSIPATSFSRYLTMPFQTESYSKNTPPTDFKNEAQDIENNDRSLKSPDEYTEKQTPDENMEQSGTDNIRPDKREKDDMKSGINIFTVILKSMQYASLCFLIAFFTWGIEYLFYIRYNKNGKTA